MLCYVERHAAVQLTICYHRILYSVDRASLYAYNLVNETNLMHNILSIFRHFIYNLYMFRTSPDPSSRGITVFITLVCYSVLVQLAVWCAGWIVHTRQLALQNNKILSVV